MKHKTTIRKHLKELRKLIDETPDPVLKRIAYTMETAVRWATEDTVGWNGLQQEAEEAAYLLKEEMKNG